MSIPLSALVPYPATRVRPSPNASPRGAPKAAIELLVLHHTAGTDEGAEAWMCNPKAQASAHLHVRRDGTTTRLVADHLAAWHAGVAEWQGAGSVNARSLGIEIGNRGDGSEAYTPAQYAAVAAIVEHYLAQGLAKENVTSHAAVARPVGRKNDPYLWDWDRMWREVARVQALALIPPPPPPAPVPEPAIPAQKVRLGTPAAAPPPIHLEPRLPEPTPARPPLAPLHVPEPPALAGWAAALAWARRAARDLGTEAAVLVHRHGRAEAERALADALRRLREAVAPQIARLPAWLAAWLWAGVEKEARRLLV